VSQYVMPQPDGPVVEWSVTYENEERTRMRDVYPSEAEARKRYAHAYVGSSMTLECRTVTPWVSVGESPTQTWREMRGLVGPTKEGKQ
jgi:hypothetical protein